MPSPPRKPAPSRPDLHARPRYTSHERPRKPSGPRLYNSRRWRLLSGLFLQSHALCVSCEQLGIVKAAEHVDHIQAHRGDPALFWDEANWQPLCASCHGQKTAAETRAAPKHAPTPTGKPGRLVYLVAGPPGSGRHQAAEELLADVKKATDKSIALWDSARSRDQHPGDLFQAMDPCDEERPGRLADVPRHPNIFHMSNNQDARDVPRGAHSTTHASFRVLDPDAIAARIAGTQRHSSPADAQRLAALELRRHLAALAQDPPEVLVVIGQWPSYAERRQWRERLEADRVFVLEADTETCVQRAGPGVRRACEGWWRKYTSGFDEEVRRS